MSDPGSTYRTRDEISTMRQVQYGRNTPQHVVRSCIGCVPNLLQRSPHSSAARLTWCTIDRAACRCVLLCACPGPCAARVRVHVCRTQERDPVERVKKLLLSRGYDASAIKAIEKSVKKEVDTAVEESKVSNPWGGRQAGGFLRAAWVGTQAVGRRLCGVGMFAAACRR